MSPDKGPGPYPGAGVSRLDLPKCAGEWRNVSSDHDLVSLISNPRWFGESGLGSRAWAI